MRVLVVGAGGREHAILRALARSPQKPELLCAPGNPGMGLDARPLDVRVDDVHRLVQVAADSKVDLVVVGPEAPLVAGIADACAKAGIRCFGPSAGAALLEGSKAHAKAVMSAAQVPTANAVVVNDVDDGMAAITRYPVVLKADGLAAGKGVVIAQDEAEARNTLEEFLVERRFGTKSVLVEDFLEGEEVSLLALCDGERAIPMAPAQDYKRIYDGDEGPNTGGMGSYSPVPGFDDEQAWDIVRRVHQPVVDALRRSGQPFHGVLYAGLMLTETGPRVLEFNVRFGDPETQAVLPRLRSDLLEVLWKATEPGGLRNVELEWDPRYSVTLVLACGGYPATSSHGDLIRGYEKVPIDVDVTHAGTALDSSGRLITSGGRVLNVTALGDDPASAREAAYAAADMIEFDGKQVRRDIAQRAVDRFAQNGAA